MTSINDIKEGKGAYYKREDIEDKEFVFVEDVKISGELRSHKVTQAAKGTEPEKVTEYFDFAIECDGEVKDIGLTFTQLKQLIEKLPADLTNLQGVRMKYNGSSGSGKKIKHKWEYLGIAAKGTYANKQTNISTGADKPAMADYMRKIMEKLEFAGKCYTDGIPANIFTEVVESELKAARIKHDGAFNEVLKALMAEGRIFEPKTGFFKVVV